MKVTFFVHGKAEPGGSKRGFINPKTKRVIITDANKDVKSWRNDVAIAGKAAWGDTPPTSEPLRLYVNFRRQRPKGHYGTGKNSGILKASAPEYPTTRPDQTKLLRAVEDALTGIIWLDDSQIVIQVARKTWADNGQEGGQAPGAFISVATMDEFEPKF